jgi:4-amino-4-deoxychorismate lyase
MPRFIETIKLLDGQLYNMSYHQERMDRTTFHFFRNSKHVNLLHHFSHFNLPQKGFFKCRVVYDRKILSMRFLPYAIKTIRSLKVVEANEIQYKHKLEDREELTSLLDKREDCDEIIIVKNKMVTDASYANLAFKRDDKWFTPITCLLNGTMRQNLIDQRKIKPKTISLDDISKFEKVKLINSMLGFEGEELDVSKIAF